MLPMKLKVLSVVALLSLLFLSAVLWRVDSFIQIDRHAWFESQSRSQASAAEQSILKDLKSTEKNLVASAALTAGLQGEPDWKLLAPYFAIAEVNFENPEKPVVEKYFTQSESPAAVWDKKYLEGALAGMRANSFLGNRFYIKPFRDSAKTSWLSVIFIDGKRGVVVFAPGEIFQGLIDSQRGGGINVQVVNDLGLAVAHDEPMYIGTVVKNDPIFEASSSDDVNQNVKIYSANTKDEFYGVWSKISQTNLRILSRATVSELTGVRKNVLVQMGLMGVGILVVSLALILWILNLATDEQDRELARARVLSTSGQGSVVATGPVIIQPANNETNTNSQKEKMAVYSRIASSLGHELRSPLLSILGYSQMILSTNPPSEIKESADSIIRESKSAKNILDKLFAFAGEDAIEKTNGKVTSALLRAIQNNEHLFSRKGIKVSKDIQDSEFTIPLHIDLLTRAFENLIVNSIEAMDRLPHKKEINISLRETGKVLQVKIQDNGEGIDASNLLKVSDPFYTTRSYQNHVGLGITHSAGIFREHNAELVLNSELGKGTIVEVNFNLPEVSSFSRPEKKSHEMPEVIVLPQEEIEKSNAEVIASVSKSAPDLDMDVDQLLSMPSEGKKQEIKKTEVLDDAVAKKALENASVDVMPLKDEQVQTDFVDKPGFKIAKKESKLALANFEVRKPGSREGGMN